MTPPLSTTLVTDPDPWEKFTLSRPEANFLASYHWGQFHRALGKTVFPYGLFSDRHLVATALFIKETAKRGHYLSIAGGPLLDWQNPHHLSTFITLARSLARQERCLFIRIRPQLLDTPSNRHLLATHGLTLAPMHLSADTTLQLDLTQPADALLAGMRKSTRYEINRSQKLGINVTTSADPADIKAFHAHQLALAKKHAFVPFTYDFLYHQFKIFSASHQALLFHSSHTRHLLASAFIIFYGQEAVYHYGISTAANRGLPGSYACQWAAILEAKRRGFQLYNFWGIAPQSASPDHRFAGVTLFKTGFGGQRVSYTPTHDLPVSPGYLLTKHFETLRAKLRRLH